jgi:hypothetical protein
MVYLIFALFATGVGIPFLFRMYAKFQHNGHLGLALGNVCFFGLVCASFVFLDSDSDVATVQSAFSIANMLLVVGVWAVLLTVLLVQFDQLPALAQLISVIVGMLIVLFSLPGEATVVLNPYQEIYDPTIMTLEMVLFVVFLVFAYVPLIRKLRRNLHLLFEKQYLLLLLGYTILASWALLLPFSQTEVVAELRRFLLPGGILLWNLALIKDPLTIVVTTSRVQKLIVLTKTGLPVFSYDLEKDQLMDTDLIAGLITAIKLSIEEFLTSGSPLTSMTFENTTLNLINGRNALLLILAQQALSPNFYLIATLFLQKFEQDYEKQLITTPINTHDFSNVIQLVHSVTNKVLF